MKRIVMMLTVAAMMVVLTVTMTATPALAKKHASHAKKEKKEDARFITEQREDLAEKALMTSPFCAANPSACLATEINEDRAEGF